MRIIKKIFLFVTKWILLLALAVIILSLLMAGPVFINFIYKTELVSWHVDYVFSAGEVLQYYGAVLGGLITCFAIITTININNKNRRADLKRHQFERAYTLYHKLPEILAKLELAAIHVGFTARLDDNKLMETLDTMKDSENILREHHFSNDAYYSKKIDVLLKIILNVSVVCQNSVEGFLQDKKSGNADLNRAQKNMEEAFNALKESINDAKSEIMYEINRFIDVYGGRV